MPLVEKAISERFKPIFEKHAKNAYIAMGAASFGEDLSVVEMTALSADMFAKTFAAMSDDFAKELVKILKSDVLVTHQLTGQVPVTGIIKLT